MVACTCKDARQRQSSSALSRDIIMVIMCVCDLSHLQSGGRVYTNSRHVAYVTCFPLAFVKTKCCACFVMMETAPANAVHGKQLVCGLRRGDVQGRSLLWADDRRLLWADVSPFGLCESWLRDNKYAWCHTPVCGT